MQIKVLLKRKEISVVLNWIIIYGAVDCIHDPNMYCTHVRLTKKKERQIERASERERESAKKEASSLSLSTVAAAASVVVAAMVAM